MRAPDPRKAPGQAGGSRRVDKQFAWLEAGAGKVALHQPSSGCFATGNGHHWAAELGKGNMIDKFGLHLVALWIERVYFLDEHWDRLRTIGKVKTLADGIEEVVFFPVRQRMPALDEQTHPEMKDPGMAQFLNSFNTVDDACDFMHEPFRCNLQSESPKMFGRKIKYLLRRSNDTYPHLFVDVVEVPSHFSILDRIPNENPYFSYIPVFDIHAYENSILIAGGPITRATDWPKGFAVKEADYSEQWSYRGMVGENILLPVTVDDEELGEIVTAVWKAKKNSLASIGKWKSRPT